MRIGGMCECGVTACPCTRDDCDHGFLPDIVEVYDGRRYEAVPPCPECKPELAELLREAVNPQAALRARARQHRRGEPIDYRRRGWDRNIAAAHQERERARADLA